MNILYLAPIAFDYLKQRPQYLAEELAKKHCVWYVEPTVSVLSRSDNGKTLCTADSSRISRSLYRVRLSGRFSLPYKLKIFDRMRLFIRYEAAQIRRMRIRFDLIWVGYCGRYDLAKCFPHIPMIYDQMDDSVLLTPDWLTRRYLVRAEAWVSARARIVLTTAKMLYEQMKSVRDQVYLLPNALPQTYEGNYLPQRQTKHREFLYIGTIAEWFDNDSIRCIAAYGNGKITLVGPVTGEKIRRSGVHYTGKVPKEKIGAYLAKSDVCLYPFQAGKLLDTINPVKIYEYLAFNKPVIARRSIETEQFQKYIYLYSNEKELRQLLSAKLEPPFATQEAYDRFISCNTWERRAAFLEQILTTVTANRLPEQIQLHKDDKTQLHKDTGGQKNDKTQLHKDTGGQKNGKRNWNGLHRTTDCADDGGARNRSNRNRL